MCLWILLLTQFAIEHIAHSRQFRSFVCISFSVVSIIHFTVLVCIGIGQIQCDLERTEQSQIVNLLDWVARRVVGHAFVSRESCLAHYLHGRQSDKLVVAYMRIYGE